MPLNLLLLCSKRKIQLIGSILLIVYCNNIHAAPNLKKSDKHGIVASKTVSPSIINCAVKQPKNRVTEPQEACLVTRTSNATQNIIINGLILGENVIYDNGQLLIGSNGKIIALGCDIYSHPEAIDAIELSCASGIVSPGFINAHDHIMYTQLPPSDWGSERFEHRHQWRLGSDDHTKIDYTRVTKDEQIMWGELRHAMAGTTSLAGEGGVSGMLRNLDKISLNEGLTKATSFTTIFPLGDLSGVTRESGCDYPKLVTKEAYAVANSFQAHVAEGVNVSAQNEIKCLTGRQKDAVNVTDITASFVHFIGANASDAKLVKDKNISVVWSPRSNMSLYSYTADIGLYKNLDINLVLSSDWMPSGSMNLLRELECASSYNENYLNSLLSDYDLWKMVTINAAKSFAVEDEIGGLAVGKFADLVIFRREGDENPFHQVINANTSDVMLVLRSGSPLLGDSILVDALSKKKGQCEVAPPSISCGSSLSICASSEFGIELNKLITENESSYGLTFCANVPDKEPTCKPSIVGKFDGNPKPGVDSDGDGDGLHDNKDNCPKIFNPIRPFEVTEGQADADKDGQGDSCDTTPFG